MTREVYLTDVCDDWDYRFYELAKHVSTWSKDPSTKVGAVIVDENRIVVGMGYNGFPRGVRDDPARYENRPTKYALIVHSEANAVFNSIADVTDCTLYSTLFPCVECAKTVVQNGVARVVAPLPSQEMQQRWGESFDWARLVLDEADVEISFLEIVS